MLEVTNLSTSYGPVQALWDVSFSVGEGEIVVLLGSNGAGKTTALKTIQGLVRPSSGEVRFLGNHLQGLPSHRRVAQGLSLVPEDRLLFPHMTVLENLELGAYPKHAREGRNATLNWIYELFPRLLSRLSQKVGTLSGGEQQMVAIGRALMSKPKLLMLDEPSLGLAPLVVAELFRIIKVINSEGISILLVEQNVTHSLALAGRAYILETGRVMRQGKGKDLLKDPEIRKAYLGM